MYVAEYHYIIIFQEDCLDILEQPHVEVNEGLTGDDGGSFPGGFSSYKEWANYRGKYLPEAIGHIYCRDGKIYCDTCTKYKHCAKLAEGHLSLKGTAKLQSFLDGVITQSSRYCNKVVKRHCKTQMHLACISILKSKTEGNIFHNQRLCTNLF